MNPLLLLIAGAIAAFGLRSLIGRVTLAKFRHDVAALNRGDYGPLLSGYADDAVLAFNDGDHRWAGEHRGKEAIEAFLADFVAAGLQGEIEELWTSGPPWAMSAVARFNDHAHGPDGEDLYSNRTLILVRTRWGKVIEQQDFYYDTVRMAEFESKLIALGIEPGR
jgi:ketosteroid isomerase-like protein